MSKGFYWQRRLRIETFRFIFGIKQLSFRFLLKLLSLLSWIIDSAVVLFAVNYICGIVVFDAFQSLSVVFLGILLSVGSVIFWLVIVFAIGNFARLEFDISVTKILVLITVSVSVALLNSIRNRMLIQQRKSVAERIVLSGRSLKVIPIKIEETKRVRQKIMADILCEDGQQRCGLKILFYISAFEDVRVGHTYLLRGNVEIPKNFSDDFDYERFLQRQGVFLICKHRCVVSANGATGGLWYRLLQSLATIRNVINTSIVSSVHEPEASIMIGLITGENRYIGEELATALQRTGTTHIIAASGYNITMFIIMVDKLLAFAGKRIRLVLSAFIILLFIIFSGFSPSVVRAGVMQGLVIFSILVGRRLDINYVLILTVLIMLLVNPLMYSDVGFLLSFFATASLFYIFPILSRIVELLFSRFSITVGKAFIEEYVLPTLSCTLGTIPISISVFGTFSTVAVFVNSLVLPLLEDVTVGSLFSILLYQIPLTVVHYVARGLFVFWWTPVHIFLMIVSWVGQFNFASFNVPKSFGILFAVILIIFVIYFYDPDSGENFYIKLFTE